ncbi:MAG TPA: glycoside hydrolase family 28 protein [Flavobacteriaceae bacterium]|nr:glycoside hydrolase family 28 protein [Flavobacteriaceae bacterium]
MNINNDSSPFNFKLFGYLAFIFFLLIGCKQNEKEVIEDKSELVNSLESIFYSDDFTSIPDKTYNTSDYGAIGDSTTLNTKSIQKAIDIAHENGGGKVIFSSGIYLSGAIFLKSNVELHLDEGVTIRAIQDDSKYPEKPTRIAGFEMDWPAALVNVYEQKNVRITGKGIIDGNGKFWWDKFWGDPPASGGMWVDYEKRNVRWAVDYDCKRVRPVVVYKSSNVLLKDFTVQRAGFWTVSLTYSNAIHVDGLVIRNNIGGFGPSSDGINSDSSSNILVENCDIDCNDDNLCIKAGRDADGLRVNRPSENIVYRNCITRSGHGLFTIGSETSGGMRNIEVYGLKAIGTNTGIRFKSAKVRGGVIENIWFHDIEMEDVKSPFHFELNWYPEYSYPTIPKEIPENEIPETWKLMTQKVIPEEKGIPEFKNITISNVDVKGAESAFYANAYPVKPIHDLKWKNVSIEAIKGGEINYGTNWDMENVKINLESDELINLKGTINISLPESLVKKIEVENPVTIHDKIKSKVEALKTTHKETSIFPINPMTQNVLFAKDTTSFSDAMTVYIFPEKSTSITYKEPLGDGFYLSLVSILFNEKENSIEVRGEKNHKWKFRLKIPDTIKNVTNVDKWEYNKSESYLDIEKESTRFKLYIK